MAADADPFELEPLSPVEAARLRPAMYLGAVGPHGVRTLITDLVGCMIEEFSAGKTTRIALAVWSDGRVMVRDDGRGLPTHIIDPRSHRPLVEWIATDPTCPYERDPVARRRRSIHACSGYFLVNAFSTSLIIENRTCGQAWQTEFARGQLVTPTHPTEPTDESGLCFTFRLDPEILKTTELDTDWLLEWLHEQSCLYPGLTLELIDERCDVHREFCSQRGVEDLVRHGIAARPQAERATLYDEPITFEIVDRSDGDENEVRVHVALQHTVTSVQQIDAYVNGFKLREGGTHVFGMLCGLLDAVPRFVRFDNLRNRDAGTLTAQTRGFELEDASAHLTAAISLTMPDPMFEGPTRNRLSNQQIIGMVRRGTRDALMNHFEQHPRRAWAIYHHAFDREA